MLKATLYNSIGEKTGEVELPESVFGVSPNNDLIHQVVVAEMANSRNTVAHTKTRGEVRGGGKKPWKQKGTGRARAGSIRSPLWKGGGVTFGPRNQRNYAKKINRRQFKKGVCMVLSDKLASQKLFVIEGLQMQHIKTKSLNTLFNTLREKLAVADSAVLIIPSKDKVIEISARNIPTLSVLRIEQLSPKKLLSAEATIVLKSSLPNLEKSFAS